MDLIIAGEWWGEQQQQTAGGENGEQVLFGEGAKAVSRMPVHGRRWHEPFMGKLTCLRL